MLRMSRVLCLTGRCKATPRRALPERAIETVRPGLAAEVPRTASFVSWCVGHDDVKTCIQSTTSGVIKRGTLAMGSASATPNPCSVVRGTAIVANTELQSEGLCLVAGYAGKKVIPLAKQCGPSYRVAEGKAPAFRVRHTVRGGISTKLRRPSRLWRRHHERSPLGVWIPNETRRTDFIARLPSGHAGDPRHRFREGKC